MARAAGSVRVPLNQPLLVAAALLLVSTWVRPDIALSLVVLAVPFSAIERSRRLRTQPAAARRAGAATDAAGFVVNEVLGAAGLTAVLVLALPIVHYVVPDGIPRTLAEQPGWLRWAEAFTISEIGGYWGHRVSHEIPVLWRFHRVHHSAPELDWLAPNRRHPIDLVLSRLSTSLPVLALGFTVPTVVTYFALKRLQGLFVHANVDLRFGWLEKVVATPFFHHWHHSDEPGTRNKNYAGSLPVVDWMFGTLHLPATWPERYGCDGDVPNAGYLARLASPWKAITKAATSPTYSSSS